MEVVFSRRGAQDAEEHFFKRLLRGLRACGELLLYFVDGLPERQDNHSPHNVRYRDHTPHNLTGANRTAGMRGVLPRVSRLCKIPNADGSGLLDLLGQLRNEFQDILDNPHVSHLEDGGLGVLVDRDDEG
jgi:hypothetical protein